MVRSEQPYTLEWHLRGGEEQRERQRQLQLLLPAGHTRGGDHSHGVTVQGEAATGV